MPPGSLRLSLAPPPRLGPSSRACRLSYPPTAMPVYSRRSDPPKQHVRASLPQVRGRIIIITSVTMPEGRRLEHSIRLQLVLASLASALLHSQARCLPLCPCPVGFSSRRLRAINPGLSGAVNACERGLRGLERGEGLGAGRELARGEGREIWGERKGGEGLGGEVRDGACSTASRSLGDALAI
eukprot:1071389-Rhodomonas_salina.4